MARPLGAANENELAEALAGGLAALRVSAYHTRDSRRSAEGFPDYILRTAPTIAVELKAEGGVLSREQGEWLRGLAQGGTIALLVVGSAGVGELLDVLTAKRGTPPVWSRGVPVALGSWTSVRLGRDYGPGWPAVLLAGAG